MAARWQGGHNHARVGAGWHAAALRGSAAGLVLPHLAAVASLHFSCHPADGSDDLVLQADMLLLAGTCIVDEAVLTGGLAGSCGPGLTSAA